MVGCSTVDTSLLSNIQKLFSEKIEIFSPVDFTKVSVLTGIIKISLKVRCEETRLWANAAVLCRRCFFSSAGSFLKRKQMACFFRNLCHTAIFFLAHVKLLYHFTYRVVGLNLNLFDKAKLKWISIWLELVWVYNGNVCIFYPLTQLSIVNVDIPRVCSPADVRSLWFTTDTSRHSLPTALPLAICCRWKVCISCPYMLF